MKNQKIKKIIRESVLNIINNTKKDSKIKKINEVHKSKSHFVPFRYRIFGGLLHSLNIQFGNFIEILLKKTIEEEKYLEIIEGVSGRKDVVLSLTKKTDSLIDKFISDRQNNNDKNLLKKFNKLLENIIINQKFDRNPITNKHDIDVLFKDKRNDIYYFIELKYDDNHDTGKFVDINRKFLKTYAGLVKKLNIQNVKKLKPIIYYLNKRVMKGNIYVPEETNIYRGEKLFKEFLTTKYDDLDRGLKNISKDKEIIKIFDNLYKKIRFDEE